VKRAKRQRKREGERERERERGITKLESDAVRRLYSATFNTHKQINVTLCLAGKTW